MCASQLSTPTPTLTTPSVPNGAGNGSLKPAAKTTLANQNTKDSDPHRPPTSNAALPALSLVPVPVPAPVVPDTPPEQSGLSSALTGAVNPAMAATQQSIPVPQAISLPVPFPTDTPALSATIPAMSPDHVLSTASAQAPGAAVAAQPAPSLPSDNNLSPAASTAAGTQDLTYNREIAAAHGVKDLSAVQQSADRPAVASPQPTIPPNEATATQFSITPSGTAAVPLALFAVATSVSVGTQSPATDQSDSPSVPGTCTGAVPDSSTPADALSSSSANDQNAEPGNALPPAFFSPIIPQTPLAESATRPPSSETLTPGAARSPHNSPNVPSSLPTLGTVPRAQSFPLHPTLPSPNDPGVSTPPADSFPGFPVALPPTAATGGNPFLGTSANSAMNTLASTTASSPAFSNVAAPALTVTGVDSKSQPDTSGDQSSDPTPHKGPGFVSLQTAGGTSPQSAPIAAANPAMPGTSAQPVAADSAHKSENPGGTGSLSSFSNLPASGEFPVHPGSGAVQMAQMVSKAAASEMRIGLNTSAFGNVEVHTVVHANEVGVLIGSEKGDLRGLLSNDLPGIANTLQQQNLRLNQVNFHQAGFAFSNPMSSGGDSQSRAFAFQSAAPLVPSARIAEDESHEPAEIPGVRNRMGSLSILA